jgi:hypothetical protein
MKASVRIFKVKVTLRLTVGLSVNKSWCRAPAGAHDQILITVWQLRSCFSWGALSNERVGLSFVHAAGPCMRCLSRVRVPWDSRPYFTLRFETSLFVASYDSQGHGGGIRPRLHTGWFRIVWDYHLYSLGTVRIENAASNSFSIVVWCVSGCCLAMARVIVDTGASGFHVTIWHLRIVVNMIQIFQNIVQWHAFVNRVLNFEVLKSRTFLDTVIGRWLIAENSVPVVYSEFMRLCFEYFTTTQKSWKYVLQYLFEQY